MNGFSLKTYYWYYAVLIFLIACQSSASNDARQPSKQQTAPVAKPKENKPADTASNPVVMNLAHTRHALHPVPVRLSNGDSFHINIPLGYQLSIAGETGRRLRFLCKSPDDRLFATDMYDRSDNKKGKLLVFEGWNDSSKSFRQQRTFLDGLHNPNQAAFYDGFLYVAETGRLRRFAYVAGDTIARDSGQTIAVFPDYGLGYKYGGWHLTRSIAFNAGKLYVSVGSSCNACMETEELRAVVLQMNPDGTDQRIYARGLRNSVGIQWIGDRLWATGMGRDLIGPDKPEDLFQQVDSGGYYGWPYYYQYQQKVYADPQFKDSARANWVKASPVALLGFKAHSAPLGFDHFAGFEDEMLNNAVLVCLHGSTSVWRQRGNAIVKVESDNRYTEIVSGFLTGKTEAERHGRPCDILMNNAKSFFFTDDLNGVLYYVWNE